ncbi:MAG TPA: GrlR family regulatory protein [Syntrophorhabdales bacterium]|nr:GrlR family regulatory protein [Syntrophorhabdales bacterium]
MLEGLWTLEFRSSIGNTGYGTVTFDGKKARGGTAGYYYVGDYHVEGNTLNAALRVHRFNGGPVSVFGPLEAFELQLSGTVSEPKMVVSGRLVDHPALKIAIICTKREERQTGDGESALPG